MRILGLMVAMVALGPKNDCGSNKEAQKDVESAAPSAVVEVTAKKLYADYEANEVSADDAYKGKVLRVSGTIAKIGKDILDDPYVALSAGDDIFEVQCMFADKGALGSLKKGQKLTLRCKGDGKMGNVILRGCVLE